MNQQPLNEKFPRHLLIALILIFPLLVSACGSSDSVALLSDTNANPGQLDLSNGVSDLQALNIPYHIGQAARVSVSLQGPDGQQYQLRQNEERSPGSYTLRVTGEIALTETNLSQTRLLPSGNYHYNIQAVASSGGATSQASGQFAIVNSPATNAIPQIDGLTALPATISPNFDAREDTSLIAWRTSQPATVTVSISNDSGFNKIITSLKNQPAQEDKTTFDGLDEKGEPLADGTYTYTIQAADQWGNVTRRAGQIQIKDGGIPTASIEQVSIEPTSIVEGGYVTVTMRVKNTGKVPIRSQGPESGYTYSTNDVYSSIESGKYKDAAGFWRVGVDYESNSGGGASRYPFRWGFGDELMPGQEVQVVGVIKVERQEQKLTFYAGLIEEQVRLPQDHLQPTVVNISY